MSLNGGQAPKARRAILVVALATFVMLGLADGSLGVAWPSLRGEFDRGISELGALLAFGSVGYLTASMAYGRVHSRLGTGAALGTGCSLTTAALVGIAVAPGWPIVAMSSVLLGLGGGLVDSGMNAHAALDFDLRSINLLHASYGVGATFGPLLITVSLTAGVAWRGGYAVLALGQAGIALVIWQTRNRWVGNVQEQAPGPAVRASRGRILLLLALFLVYTGAEVGAGQWAYTLLNEGRGLSTAAAGGWVAAYWGGLTAGRFLFSALGHRASPSGTLNGSVALAVIGLSILWWDPSGIGFVGLPIAGMGFAAVFPTLVSLTPARIGRDRSTRMVGYQLAAANIGAASVPWTLGLLAESYGLAALGPGLFGSAVAVAVLHLWSDRSG